MPIYEYRCPSCKNKFEKIYLKYPKRFSAVCPKCATRSKKVVSASSFILKGSGFYATDYKKPAGRVREDKDE